MEFKGEKNVVCANLQSVTGMVDSWGIPKSVDQNRAQAACRSLAVIFNGKSNASSILLDSRFLGTSRCFFCRFYNLLSQFLLFLVHRTLRLQHVGGITYRERGLQFNVCLSGTGQDSIIKAPP